MFNKKILVFMLVFILVLGTVAVSAEEWEPERTIKFVVPYAAGGGIDRITRALQPHLEEYLDVPIAVVNMPGGSTVVAYEHVFNSRKDGYTVLSTSPEIATMAVMGNSDLLPEDWINFGINASFPNCWVVSPDSPIKTPDDLFAALDEEKLSVGHAAYGGAWQQGIMLGVDLAGAKNDPEFVPQGGGFIAAQAAMKNEVDFASVGVCEVTELLPAGKLRALAYMGAEPYKMEGYGEIPSVLEYLPDAAPYLPFGGWTGFAVPEGTPANIVEKLEEAYAYAVQAEEYKNFCNENAFMPLYKRGADAEEYVYNYASVSAPMLYEAGYAKNSPEEVGFDF